MSNIGYKKAKPKTKRRVIIAALSVALVLLLLLAGLWRISGYKRFFRDSVENGAAIIPWTNTLFTA